jgi:hypothetical protein
VQIESIFSAAIELTPSTYEQHGEEEQRPPSGQSPFGFAFVCGGFRDIP